jgi:hypothetical protein
MASIGGYTLYIEAGKLNRQGITLREISRPGVDGQAYQDVGMRARASQVRTFGDFDTDADAEQRLRQYKALQGTLVTVVDETDQTFSNVCVLSVEAVATPRYPAAAGGLAETTARTGLTCVWLLQVTEYMAPS